MPKLDTTIENLERKTNKVIGNVPSPTWTDEQYPSAKTLYNAYANIIDLMHPVDSVLITSTKVNPAAALGGTWELVNKCFKDTCIILTSEHITSTKVDIEGNSNLSLVGNTLSLQLALTVITELNVTGNQLLGKLALDSCGITQLSHTIFNATASSSEGNCTINYRIEPTGEINVYNALNVDNTHTIAEGTTFYINLLQPIPFSQMQDEYCDKFYWKRTA